MQPEALEKPKESVDQDALVSRASKGEKHKPVETQ